MSTESSNGHVLLRRALLFCGTDRVLALVEQLNLQPTAGVDILVVAPLRLLKKSRALATFAAGAPMGAIRLLAELLSQDALERVVTLLDDSSNDPSFEELSDAVGHLADEGVAPEVVATMLVFAVVSEVPAAPHCQRLLEERLEFALPELDVVVAKSPLLNPKTVDPLVREQRRQRREDQKSSRQRAKTRPPSRGSNRESTQLTTAPSTPGATVHVEQQPEELVDEFTRRRVILTPLESAQYASDHPLSGFVIELDVAYDEGQTDDSGATSKTRPVVVVAGSATSLLVRPIFSQPGLGRTPLSGWNRLGLAHPSYVDLIRHPISFDPSLSPRRFGLLTDDEWNALF